MRVVRARRAALGAVLGFVFASSGVGPVHAQANYRLPPVGGRTTLVGGTGLAFGRDSASAFLNPATVVRVDAGRLAFSVNFYEVSLFRASRWYAPGDIDRAHFGDVANAQASASSLSFATLPSSLCVFLRAGDIPSLAGERSRELEASPARLGLCLATVQSSSFGFNREDFASASPSGTTRQASTFLQSFRRSAVGPTYALHVTNDLTLGISLLGSRASFQSFIENTATTYGGAPPVTAIFYSSARGSSYDVSATIGATYRITRHQTVAAALEAPTLHVLGHGGLSAYSHYDATTSGTTSSSATGDFAANAPLRVAVGTGVQSAWGTAELNVSLHLPIWPAYTAQLDGHRLEMSSGARTDVPASLDLSTRARGAVNIGVGGEVNASRSISALGGLSTDLSGVPKGALLSDPMTYFPSRTQKVAASIGLGSHGEGGDLYFGGEIGYSWGERLAVNAYQLPPRLATTSYDSLSLIIVIAGTTSFRAIKRAVSDLTDVVDPFKRPTPPPAEPPASR